MPGSFKEKQRKGLPNPEANQEKGRSWYPYRPILVEAGKAHQEGLVAYDENGVVTFRHSDLPQFTQQTEVRIPPNHQHPTIFNSFMALNKTLSSMANSPLLAGEKTLRQAFDEEFSHYRELVNRAQSSDQWEPDYGSYVFDHIENRLYLILPEFWYRLNLVTSNSKILTDPEGKLSWWEIREKLENTVVGFAGLSVGGGVLEGWLREGRPRKVKITDPDAWEMANLNRAERMSMRYLSASRDQKKNPRHPYEITYANKADTTAYEQHLVDPHLKLFVYSEGVSEANLERFLLGNGQDEPPIDLLVEEVDDLRMKVILREKCREHGIPVLMMSDFGLCPQRQFQDYERKPETGLGYQTRDEELKASLEQLMTTGNREDFIGFARALCGPEFAQSDSSFDRLTRGEGEQPTSSLPQSGAIALTTGGIGGLTIALWRLGHEIPERTIFDLSRGKILID